MELKKQTLKQSWAILLETYEHPERYNSSEIWAKYACIRLKCLNQHIPAENIDKMLDILEKHLGPGVLTQTKPFKTMKARLSFIRRKVNGH